MKKLLLAGLATLALTAPAAHAQNLWEIPSWHTDCGRETVERPHRSDGPRTYFYVDTAKATVTRVRENGERATLQITRALPSRMFDLPIIEFGSYSTPETPGSAYILSWSEQTGRYTVQYLTGRGFHWCSTPEYDR